jgi:alpha-L-rhamnosidase
MIFDVLRLNNRNDIAYRITNKKEYPGWLHMMEKGATTLWETWQFPETGPSRNHPMFGSIDEWFYRSLAGINPAAPGFEKILIKPQPVKELSWAKGTYQSIRGMISSEWRNEAGQFTMNVTIPPNTSAEIWIPANPQQEISESNKRVEAVRYENGYAIVMTGSGNYSYQVK